MRHRRIAAHHLEFIASQSGTAANPFVGAAVEPSAEPAFADAWPRLPQPHWPAQPDVLACYRRTWELAFANRRQPARGSGFIAPFSDTAFNGALFLWDSVFILEFARLGRRVIDAQRTLDNLYAKQWEDGFISREVRQDDGGEQFHRHDPPSTGPNLLAWSEWRHFQATGDRDRLVRVLPALLGYHRWLRAHRTWPDGTYWHCGLACGMDNQCRFGPLAGLPAEPGLAGWEQDDLQHVHHGWMAWIDAGFQALLSARCLMRIAAALGREGEVADCAEEAAQLAQVLHASCWDERRRFYTDRDRHGRTTGVVTCAGLWALTDPDLPAARLDAICAWLDDPAGFNRPHRVPSLPASHPAYDPTGGYWNGAVWPPIVAMVLDGLHAHGRDRLAHDIARSHLDQVVETFRRTGSVFENYAPESPARGKPSKSEFVGWGGVGPVAVLIQSVLGLRADAPARRLVVDVRLLDEHGCDRLPVGEASVDVRVAARTAHDQPPVVTARSDRPVTLDIRWADRRRELAVG